MKHKRIVPSSQPVTSIRVAGKPYHYFHSEALGGCRAIIIGPDENLPRPAAQSHRQMIEEIINEYEAEIAAKKAPKQFSKGEQLEMLMDTDTRLCVRFAVAWTNYQMSSDRESQEYWFARAKRVQRAITRVAKKIGLLFVDEGK
ncbi:MAG TPA: hypothetical protein V6C65_08935 [Allocoleopsis sp.]